MFGKLKKLVRKSKGMEALQAVLLVGAGFLVVFGLMTLWSDVAQPKVEQATKDILDGKKRTASP